MFTISNTDFFYFAIDMDIYHLMIKQNFKIIREFDSTLGEQFIENVTYENAILDIRDLQKYDIPYDSFKEFGEANKVTATLTGSVNYSLSGQVVGIFKLPGRD